MDKANMYWQTYLNLENELIELSKYIYITDTKTTLNTKSNTIKTIECNHQLETYSNYIADLLIRCCVEIESISKELYFDNGGTKSRGSVDLYFDTDCLALLNSKWGLGNKVVMVVASNFNLSNEENYVLTPLNKADKRSKTMWSKAYQAVKHDRYNSLHLGNIKALIHSLAALYLLNIYYRDVKFSAKYPDLHKLDMSLGSKIFSLTAPNQNAVSDIINGKKSDDFLKSGTSPYIAKYTDEFYKQVLLAKQQYADNMNNYLMSQPELKEPEFIQYLRDVEENNPNKKIILLWELCKYRINKKIPTRLSFEDRKALFIQSEEWNGQVRRNNKHLLENELTPENIQKEIEEAAIMFGMEIENSFSSNFMFKAFNEGYCEVVLDKRNIKYK